MKNAEIKYYNSVESRNVDWLWYPYIPYGKITIIQGDPGEGKTTFVLNLAALLSKGETFPNQENNKADPVVVIYQNAEDGIADTIKPRLDSVDADCNNIAFLEVGNKHLTLNDSRLEQAIIKSNAKLLVFDPLQAYIGNVDMHRANDIRPIMKSLATVAENTGCAIVLVGHMNKSSNKGLYRGLGSIDITAAARSVLLVGRVADDPNIRAVSHIKSNLAPEGASFAFELNPDSGFRWIGDYSISSDELLGNYQSPDESKPELAQKIISTLFEKHASILSETIYDICLSKGISRRTVERAKKLLNLCAVKIHTKWYYVLPQNTKEGIDE